MSEKKQQKKKKTDEKKQQIDELTSTLQRLQADFENYKKRVEAQKSEYKEYYTESFIENLLPILDNFEVALKNTTNHEQFQKGMELIYSQIIDILKKAGVQRIESLNKAFDPNLHEALLAEDSDKEKNMVIEELQPGYKTKSRVLRHTKVKVSK
ncbi:nucleotide exchange factor GrpE [Candidatus Woesearchaeota archaeon]|nr:nucleotide exchange factor GrpE [Candidatus Woesearchaeota archaeon]